MAKKEKATRITLQQGDTAIVFKKDGSADLFLSNKDPSQPCSQADLIVVGFLSKLREAGFAQSLVDYVHSMQEVEEGSDSLAG